MSNGFHANGDLRATLSEDLSVVAVEEYENGRWVGRDWGHCTAETVDDDLAERGYLVGEWFLADGIVRVPLRRITAKAVA